MQEEKKPIRPKAQSIMLENRQRLSVTGVVDVDSFNDECIIVQTDLGALQIRGSELHISKLNLDNSELYVEGEIESIEYNDSYGSGKRGSGFLSKMFK